MEMGKSTGDMTTGLYQVISAFGYGSDSLAQLELNARAASAGLATTEQAIALTSAVTKGYGCLLYTSPSPRDRTRSRMPSSALKKKPTQKTQIKDTL